MCITVAVSSLNPKIIKRQCNGKAIGNNLFHLNHLNFFFLYQHLSSFSSDTVAAGSITLKATIKLCRSIKEDLTLLAGNCI